MHGVIGTSVYSKLKSVISSRGDWIPNDRLKPWAMWRSLGGWRGTFYPSDDDSNPNEPVLDDWLQKRAYRDGKTVVGLESLEEGFTKYDTIPVAQQIDLLRGLLDNYYRRRKGAPLVQSYVEGDLRLFAALWKESMGWYSPEVAEMLTFRILTNRNHIMVDRMLPLMRDASTFVAVGAGHLAGEEGVLRLLEKQGYTVTRLH